MTLPSHVTLLTGLLPPEHGVRNNVGFSFDCGHHWHLPGFLKAKGYATGAAVSSYVLRGETGLAGLFDEYEDSGRPAPRHRLRGPAAPGDGDRRLREALDRRPRLRPLLLLLPYL